MAVSHARAAFLIAVLVATVLAQCYVTVQFPAPPQRHNSGSGTSGTSGAANEAGDAPLRASQGHANMTYLASLDLDDGTSVVQLAAIKTTDDGCAPATQFYDNGNRLAVFSYGAEHHSAFELEAHIYEVPSGDKVDVVRFGLVQRDFCPNAELFMFPNNVWCINAISDNLEQTFELRCNTSGNFDTSLYTQVLQQGQYQYEYAPEIYPLSPATLAIAEAWDMEQFCVKISIVDIYSGIITNSSICGIEASYQILPYSSLAALGVSDTQTGAAMFVTTGGSRGTYSTPSGSSGSSFAGGDGTYIPAEQRIYFFSIDTIYGNGQAQSTKNITLDKGYLPMEIFYDGAQWVILITQPVEDDHFLVLMTTGELGADVTTYGPFKQNKYVYSSDKQEYRNGTPTAIICPSS